MTARTLTKPQWDAALHAAKWLAAIDISKAEDRASFRDASLALSDLLDGDDVSAGRYILEALSWYGKDQLAGALIGLPLENVS